MLALCLGKRERGRLLAQRNPPPQLTTFFFLCSCVCHSSVRSRLDRPAKKVSACKKSPKSFLLVQK